jgi:Arc/MetJ-type ribon-helix-helix transcriptional regulator
MPLSVRLTPKEKALLETASRKTARSKSELVRQGVRELCQRLTRGEKTPYDLGKKLFGVGSMSAAPTDSIKRAVWEKLRAKHGRVG